MNYALKYMAIFKCKMCGGALAIGENQSVATCEYCGTQQTLPKLDNEKKVALFSRANNLRIKSEFDKAAGIYESIIAEFRDEAEAYWGLVLCKYGIEYVDDGKGSRIPTCHRTLPLSIMEDDDFQQACEYADITAKNIYRDEAKAIDKIQKKILNIALNEDPYDIFICYKETDDVTGSRTEDSLIAQDIYTGLLKDGYRVFFARVSLREVAGTEYEPYIYAALSSAKIMLAIGTKHDYYDAVWVKNEWSRFISMMSDDSEKVLIPCFRNMDAYDMPKEFKNMQALDMGEVTFFGSLMENIERILEKSKGKAIKETIVVNNDNTDVAPLLERGFMFLEDKEWDRADEFFENVLNKDPKNAQAYLGKLLADLEVSKFEKLSEFHTTFSDSSNYEKIMRFGDNDLKETVKKCNDIVARRIEEARKKAIYESALEIMEAAETEEMFENAGYMFQEVKDYADAKEKSEECFLKAEDARKDKILSEAKGLMDTDIISCYESAIQILKEIPGWKDADEKILDCRKRIEEIKAKEEADRIKQEKQAEITRQNYEKEQRRLKSKAKKNKIFATIGFSAVAVVLVVVIVINSVVVPSIKYSDAVALMDEGKYEEAIIAFEALGGYGDSEEKIIECNKIITGYNDALLEAQLGEKYDEAISLMNNNEYLKALTIFFGIGGYKDGKELCSKIMKKIAVDETLFTSDAHTVGIKSDGTVVATGRNYEGQCNVSDWTDIVSISTGGCAYTVGLKSDGTVVAVGKNDDGQCDVSDWTDIVAISTGYQHTVGLKSDGTVVAVGENGDGQCDVSDWTDIVAISAGSYHTVGLKSDGTVVATEFLGNTYNYYHGQCGVSDWTDIVAISAGSYHTVGLKSDGTVVATEFKEGGPYINSGQCNVQDWTDIVSISAGGEHTVGLKSNGTVVATGWNGQGQCNVSDWTNIKLPNTNK